MLRLSSFLKFFALLLSLQLLPAMADAQSYDPRTWRNITVRKIPGEINSPTIEVVSCFSPDGRKLWFSTKRTIGLDQLSSCSYIDGEYGTPDIRRDSVAAGATSIDGEGNVYFAKLKSLGDTINQNNIDIFKRSATGRLEALPSEINTPKWESQPHISLDGKTLLYSVAKANRKQEVDVDIYVSHFENGAWTKGQSVGATVNLLGYEGFPVLSPDGKYLFFMRRTNRKDPTLYYCSIGPTGTGEANPLPVPINTGMEMSLAFHPTENMLVIGSARRSSSTDDFDLYEVRYDVEQ